MKHFIYRLLFFIVILIASATIIDFAISPFLFAKGTLSIWYNIYHKKASPEVAFFGSSRCQMYFDCKIIEDSIGKKAWNFGISNAKIDVSCLCLDYYLTQNKNTIKYITLETGYLTMWDSDEFTNYQQLFPILFLNKHNYQYVSRYKGFELKQVYLPLYRYCGYFWTMVKDAFATENLQQGFYPANIKWPFDNSGTSNEGNYSYTIDTSRIKYLDKFVSLCKANNIQLNFVYVPEHTDYYLQYNNKQEIVSFFENYAKKNNIPFKDFSQDTKFNSDTSFFYNIEHVNKHGAEEFTRNLFIPYFKQLYNL